MSDEERTVRRRRRRADASNDNRDRQARPTHSPKKRRTTNQRRPRSKQSRSTVCPRTGVRAVKRLPTPAGALSKRGGGTAGKNSHGGERAAKRRNRPDNTPVKSPGERDDRRSNRPGGHPQRGYALALEGLKSMPAGLLALSRARVTPAGHRCRHSCGSSVWAAGWSSAAHARGRRCSCSSCSDTAATSSAGGST